MILPEVGEGVLMKFIRYYDASFLLMRLMIDESIFEESLSNREVACSNYVSSTSLDAQLLITRDFTKRVAVLIGIPVNKLLLVAHRINLTIGT